MSSPAHDPLPEAVALVEGAASAGAAGRLAGAQHAFQVILILLMSLWFFGWVGTLFLSSTRVIFAAAFDRILPDGAAQVSEKRRVPVWSLVLMLLPAVGLAALYSYNSTFHTYTLDATLVIAVTYLFSAIAVVILPWRKPDLWRASPALRIKLLGVPIVPAAGVVTIGLDRVLPVRVAVQQRLRSQQQDSLIYMGAMYVLALVIYIGRARSAAAAGHRPVADQQGDPGRVESRQSRRRMRIIRHAAGSSRAVVSSKSP